MDTLLCDADLVVEQNLMRLYAASKCNILMGCDHPHIG